MDEGVIQLRATDIEAQATQSRDEGRPGPRAASSWTGPASCAPLVRHRPLRPEPPDKALVDSHQGCWSEGPTKTRQTRKLNLDDAIAGYLAKRRADQEAYGPQVPTNRAPDAVPDGL